MRSTRSARSNGVTSRPRFSSTVGACSRCTVEKMVFIGQRSTPLASALASVAFYLRTVRICRKRRLYPARTLVRPELAMSIETEVHQLQHTLSAATERLRELKLDDSHASRLPNALLILAIQQMIARDGAPLAATVLRRLADSVLAGPAPPP